MKKIVSILLSTIIFCSLFAVPLSVGAKTINIESSSSADCEDGYRFVEIYKSGITKDGWEYDIIKEQNINTDEYKFFAAIGSYKGTATTVTLPTNVSTSVETFNVLKYYDGSLRDSSTVKKAIIPNSNTKIQISNSFFWGSTTLEEVTIGSAAKNIYTSMFESDTKLKTVNFTKEFLAQKPYIGSRAFAKCTSLRNLVLPNGISGIADDALVDAKNLETVSCGKDIEEFGIYNNVNLKKITLNCKKAKTRLYFNNFGWEGVNHNPKAFNYKPVIVECYSGTEAEYYKNNVYMKMTLNSLA